MYLETLYLKNFRNYKEEVFHFSPHVNQILGDNGAGKTNLLEAIYLLSTGRSFKAAHLQDLIHYDAKYFYIEAHFHKDNIPQSIKITYQKSLKKCEYNATVYPNFSSLFGILPSVIFATSDVELISGNPLERRRFLNMHLAQVDPLYVYHLARFHKALKQRNALLKQKKRESLGIWEQQIANSSLYPMKKRAEHISKITASATLFLKKISGKNDLFSIRYIPSIPLNFPEENPIGHICKLYEKIREKELLLSTTLIGPHRDDFSITLEKKAAKGFASEGQKQSIIASLKCAEWNELKEKHEEMPILSIDDFGSHLDPHRMLLFEQTLPQRGQIFLTMPHDLLSKKNLSNLIKTFHIRPLVKLMQNVR